MPKGALHEEYAHKEEGYYTNNRKEMLDFVPRSTQRVLDVGCGTGTFGAAVHELTKAEVWGVEPFAPAAEEAVRRLHRVIVAPFDSDVDLPEHHFDCIFFNDVLEHLVDPFAALRDTRRLLAPDGVVIASIPNLRYFSVLYDLTINGTFTYADHGILDRTHLRFFTQRSIRQTFEECGYEVVRLEGIRPANSWKLRLLNLLLFKRFSDTLFPQFAIVAHPNS